MQRKKLVRKALVVTLALVTTAMLVVGTTVVGNSYRFRQVPVTIPGPDGNLAGVLTLPVDGSARGLVVMVHGDGSVEATQDGLYSPWFEGAADAGFATLSWSKPGIGGSDGDWLSQSMKDRADEVSAVLDWADQSKDVPTDAIVLWGASQAGWVLPKVIGDRDDIDGVVAVGTAISWIRQGRFNLLAQLDYDDASPQERERVITESDETLALLQRGATYKEYRASTTSADRMTEDRWGFVMRNFNADATEDLITSASQVVPVHLMVGRHDRNVDVAETEQTYRSILGPSLTVTHIDGAHSLARTVMEDNEAVGLATGIVWPRALLAPGVIKDYRAFLSTIGR
ncbi:alpha/beta hydrolase family protein [Microbacterium sp. NPDC056052]|uniref:alpha/beta hydrolase family protein n=1 Tax=Microbacterium sp. NPDC056052 TaxID=3345695 RepID=UPI0035D545B3